MLPAWPQARLTTLQQRAVPASLQSQLTPTPPNLSALRGSQCSRPSVQVQQRTSAWRRRVPRRLTALHSATGADAPGTLNPGDEGVVSLPKDLKLQGDKIAGDLARRVDSGEIGGEDVLLRDYGLLSEKFEELSGRVVDGLGGTPLYLVGMMGSGKSTVGRVLANVLKYCFFDSDALLEQAAGKTVAEMFAEGGEEEFREAETQVLKELAPFRDVVVATGGGAVTRRENWGAMQGGVVVWLQGPTTLLARRVAAQGTESRPLLAGQEGGQDEHAATVARLDALMEQRRELYRNADVEVSIADKDGDGGAPAAVVAYRVLEAVDARIRESAEERAAKANFTIEGASPPRSMRVVEGGVSGGLALGGAAEKAEE